MDRYWHLTWTTYGTRLAGSAGGFVSNVYADDGGREVRHNLPGTPVDANLPAQEGHVRAQMLDDPFYLTAAQAEVMIAQYRETSRIRGFEL